MWPLRHRIKRETLLVWIVLALFAVARFFEFFLRSDGTGEALGLNGAQWTSIVLLAVAAAGAYISLRPGTGAVAQRRTNAARRG